LVIFSQFLLNLFWSIIVLIKLRSFQVLVFLWVYSYFLTLFIITDSLLPILLLKRIGLSLTLILVILLLLLLMIWLTISFMWLIFKGFLLFKSLTHSLNILKWLALIIVTFWRWKLIYLFLYNDLNLLEILP
jgi:hypothetical protein